MKLTNTCVHFLFLVYYFRTVISSPIESQPGRSLKQDKAAISHVPNASQSSSKKYKQVIKSSGIQGSLKKNDLAGLTKDQFIDLLSAAASDTVDINEHGSHDDFDEHSPLDNEESSENNELSKTCGIAMRAAEEAKAASQAQNSAGLQAAREVKLQLAEKAQRAANAAQAALSEKQNEMHMLEDQMHDAETVMLEEHDSLNQTRQNVDTAAKTVENAKEQYRALETAMKLSKQTITSAEELAQGAQHELNEKIKLMTAAKSKVSELERELEKAKKEFLNTRESALRAAEAAKEAQMNANQSTK
ncbi:hypothetical protein M8J77_005872 [Diaphorina citri]|nr:hypothetical protein M8J77_005872 [Diaphorina citri]